MSPPRKDLDSFVRAFQIYVTAREIPPEDWPKLLELASGEQQYAFFAAFADADDPLTREEKAEILRLLDEQIAKAEAEAEDRDG